MKRKNLKMLGALAALCLVLPLISKADEKKSAAKAYPLKTCVVSDEKLGEHGKPYVFTHEGKEIQLCCKSCLKDFKKAPDKYVKKINEAEAKGGK